jgi:hypothetical protein
MDVNDRNISTNQKLDHHNPNLLTPSDLDHTFIVHVRIVKKNNDSTEFNRLQCIYLILKAFQTADAKTKTVLPETETNKKLNFRTIDTNRNTDTNNQRIEKCLRFTNTDTIEGNIMITRRTPYSVLKKTKKQKGCYNPLSKPLLF